MNRERTRPVKYDNLRIRYETAFDVHVTTPSYYACTSGDECGQLHTVTDAANNVTTYNTYDAHGLPLTVTDLNGATITLEYDERQRLTSRTVSGEETAFEYWPTGLLKKITQPDASFIEYDYDDAHRLTSVTDTAGNTISYTLNDAGQRLTEEVRNASNVLTFRKTRVYNDLGRLIEENGEADQLTSFDYDAEGNLIEIEDPVGNLTQQAYDELNRLSSITDPAEQFTELLYDDRDNLLEVIDPRALSTTYVRISRQAGPRFHRMPGHRFTACRAGISPMPGHPLVPG